MGVHSINCSMGNVIRITRKEHDAELDKTLWMIRVAPNKLELMIHARARAVRKDL